MSDRIAIESLLRVYNGGFLGMTKPEWFVLSVKSDGSKHLASYKTSNRTTPGKVCVDLSAYTKHTACPVRENVILIYLTTQRKPLELVAADRSLQSHWLAVLADEIHLRTSLSPQKCFIASVVSEHTHHEQNVREYGLLRQAVFNGEDTVHIISSVDERVLATWSVCALKQLTLIMPLKCERVPNASLKREDAKIIVDHCDRFVCHCQWPCQASPSSKAVGRFVVPTSHGKEPAVWHFLQQVIMAAVGQTRIAVSSGTGWPSIEIVHVCADGKRPHQQSMEDVARGQTPQEDKEQRSAEKQELPNPTSLSKTLSQCSLNDNDVPLPTPPELNSVKSPPRDKLRPGYRPRKTIPRPDDQETLEPEDLMDNCEFSRKGLSTGHGTYFPISIPEGTSGLTRRSRVFSENPSYVSGGSAVLDLRANGSGRRSSDLHSQTRLPSSSSCIPSPVLPTHSPRSARRASLVAPPSYSASASARRLCSLPPTAMAIGGVCGSSDSGTSPQRRLAKFLKSRPLPDPPVDRR